MIAVIRSTGSNFASVNFALQRIGADAIVTDDSALIEAATHVIMPGVGSAQTAMSKLRHARLEHVVRRLTQPVLGICLGMQLMFEHSEEGDTEGLAIFSGVVTRLQARERHPVPHMGWNTVDYAAGNSSEAPWAYFVHSFAAPVGPDTVATTSYTETFASVVARENFMGVQFHPERSADFGSTILTNFLQQTWTSIPQ
jgi:glutamine amidotransferase